MRVTNTISSDLFVCLISPRTTGPGIDLLSVFLKVLTVVSLQDSTFVTSSGSLFRRVRCLSSRTKPPFLFNLDLLRVFAKWNTF